MPERVEAIREASSKVVKSHKNNSCHTFNLSNLILRHDWVLETAAHRGSSRRGGDSVK